MGANIRGVIAKACFPTSQGAGVPEQFDGMVGGDVETLTRSRVPVFVDFGVWRAAEIKDQILDNGCPAADRTKDLVGSASLCTTLVLQAVLLIAVGQLDEVGARSEVGCVVRQFAIAVAVGVLPEEYDVLQLKRHRFPLPRDAHVLTGTVRKEEAPNQQLGSKPVAILGSAVGQTKEKDQVRGSDRFLTMRRWILVVIGR